MTIVEWWHYLVAFVITGTLCLYFWIGVLMEHESMFEIHVVSWMDVMMWFIHFGFYEVDVVDS